MPPSLRRLLVLFAVLLHGTSAAGEAHLQEAARLWHQLRFEHPALGDGRVDWDRALVAAVPALKTSRSDAELEQALRIMLAPLGESGARVEHPAPFATWPAGRSVIERLGPHAVVLHLHPGSPQFEALEGAKVAELIAAVRNTRIVVIDIRPVKGETDTSDSILRQIVPALIRRPLTLPAEQYRFQSDLDSPQKTNTDGFLSGYLVMSTERWDPAPGGYLRRLAFVVDGQTQVPRAALALQAQGRAAIVAVRGERAQAFAFARVRVGNLTVTIPKGQLVSSRGPVEYAPDAVSAPESVHATAVALAGTARKRAHATAVPLPLLREEQPYKDMAAPSYAWRVLAVVKLWSHMKHYFPYLALMSGDWDASLAAALAEMAGADSAERYAAALARMASTLDDGHVQLFSSGFRNMIGRGSLPLALREMDGRIVVWRSGTDAVPPGHQLLRIDGKPVEERIRELLPLFAGATPAGKTRAALARVLSGAPDNDAVLELAGAGGKPYALRLTRQAKTSFPPQWPDRKTVEILQGNVGYVNLDVLERDGVEAMIAMLKDAAAIVFDMRGYPHGTAWTIAPWLNVRQARFGSVFHQQFHSAHPALPAVELTWREPLPSGDGIQPYRGKVVMLIDESTMSQAEQTALMFEEAAHVTFIGSPTAGANGDIRNVALPGGVTVSFSGYGVTHADGRQLQRRGIQPHIEARPTIEGLRRGKDEVLERALAFLREGK